MGSQKPLDFLEELASDVPDLASDLAELASLYQRKLWHQLTLKVEACFNQPAFNQGDLPVRFFHNFVADFAHKINLLKVAQLAVHASKYFHDPPKSIDFLNGVVAKLEELKNTRTDQPILFLKMHVAQFQLERGAVAECRQAVDAGREQLEAATDVDPSVSAAVYYVASLYHKAMANFADFYRSSLVYLSFVSSDSLPTDFKQKLAVDVSLAALLGEHIYSFGQLLQHPIVAALDEGGYTWLHELLRCFNDGDLHKYDELCSRYAAQLNAQPALVAHERQLREKVTLMALMDLIGGTPAEDRCIGLPAIAQRTKLSVDGVEFLLMKALALHLIEGTIDQVDSTVHVSWVQPRILTKPQVTQLKERLDGWISKVSAVADVLEQEGLGVVQA